MMQFVAIDGTVFNVIDEAGVEFMDSTDGVGMGMGIVGLSVPLGVTPVPDYCNYTVTVSDLESCIEFERDHIYPAYAEEGRIYVINEAVIEGENITVETEQGLGRISPVPGKTCSIECSILPVDYKGDIFLVYSNVSKDEDGAYTVRLQLKYS